MTENEKVTLRINAKYLGSIESIVASKDMTNVLSNCLLKLFYERDKTPYKNTFERDAKLVAQMLFTKLLSLNQMLNGIGFQSSHGLTFEKIIDATVFAGLVRTFLETISMFNLIYIYPPVQVSSLGRKKFKCRNLNSWQMCWLPTANF